MRILIYITTFLFLISCDNINTNQKVASSTYNQNKVLFPIEAKFKNPDRQVEDSLIATVDKTDFLITPEGKMYWGPNPSDTIQLQTDKIIEKAYLFKIADTLLIFYTETDYEGATSRLEKINLTLRKRILTAEIQGFNLGLPHIVANYVYVTTIGVVGKLNLYSGQYVYQYFDLYDDKKFSFNSFDTIIFKDTLIYFLSKNYKSKHIDSLIVNEKTGGRTIRK